MELKLSLALIVFVLALSAHAHGKKGGKGEAGKSEKGKNKNFKMVKSCLGQAVNVSSQLLAVDECLETQINEVIETIRSSAKNENKKQKRIKKLSKKLRKKCRQECEWRSFGLVPNATEEDGSKYDSTSLDFSDFLEFFPQDARTSLQTGMLTCYQDSQIQPLREGNGKNVAQQMCSRNKKLFKCLQKTIKRTCKGIQSGISNTEQPELLSTPQSEEISMPDESTSTKNSSANASLPGTNNSSSTDANTSSQPSTSPSPTTKKVMLDDDVSDDADDYDPENEDNDDEDSNEDEEDSPKQSTPSTPVNTSEPLTK